VSKPLEGFRVVESGTLEAVAYCGKLFADFGAEVFKVEPSAGDPLRSAAPLIGPQGLEQGGLFAWLNAGKQSLTLDSGDREMEALLARSDVFIDAEDPAGAAVRHAALRARSPHLTIISLSWFGETGPYAGFIGDDSVCRALAGLIKQTGTVEGPPLTLPDHQVSILAGITAFTAGVAALFSESRGRRFEVSAFEALTVISEFPAMLARREGIPPKRLGLNMFHPTYPLGIYRCREGWLGVTIGNLAQWKTFCKLFGFEDWLADPVLQDRFGRSARMLEMDPRIAARLTEKTADEWFELGLAHRLPMVVVPTMSELLAQPVHRNSGAFARISVEDAHFEGPTTPLRLRNTPPESAAQSPRLGSADEDWRDEASKPRRSAPRTAPAGKPDRRPLEGIRILDLSMGWAGPLATRQLADLGATVFKIEACAYPDWFRPTFTDLSRPHERSLHFSAMNRGKYGATLDIYTPVGAQQVREFVRKVDAVVENYSADVMPKVGLDYEHLREINPSIVMLSMPAFSAYGPWRSMRAFGSTLEHASGLPTVSGRSDQPPVLNHIAYGDPIGGLNGAAALMVALLHRKRTGQGQHVDLSQVLAMLPMAAPWIIEQSITGSVKRLGNRHPRFVPHGVFKCAGEDQWVVISVTTDPAWRSLSLIIGRDDWAQDPGLRTAERRRDREGELEAAIEQWTLQREPRAIMNTLQAVGVAAGVVQNPADLFDDPHLLARNYWQMIDRAWSGVQPILSAPFREDGSVYPIEQPAPTLGEHNRLILCEHLGLNEAELLHLLATGVSGTNVPGAT
jgi:crotonobetainyl-CoA:carnitine CoA-transferase CaiB-like acyl-CoA transferase